MSGLVWFEASFIDDLLCSLSCLARMPDVDSEDGRFDSQNSRLVSNGKEVSVRLELGFPAQLVDSDPRDNTTITICDTRLCVGDRYTLALEFDSNPEPDTVEWVVRSGPYISHS